MSIILSLDSITEELRSIITRKCSVKQAKTQYNSNPSLVECFEVCDEGVYVPLGIWRDIMAEFPSYPEDTYSPMGHGSKCTKVMYTLQTDPKGCRDQDVVTSEAFGKLQREHKVFIAAFPGFGKTSCGNYLAHELGLKTLVISHINAVNEQWVKEFQQYSTSKVQYVKGKKLDPSADVYVMGVLKAAGMPREAFAQAGVGTVIFDEAHIATITAFTKSLLRMCPKYVIGLSGTPERGDGMQKMLTMYFGPKKTFIHRHETKDFVVYKKETPYKPTVNYKVYYGKTTLDWTCLINSLAYNNERQKDIVDVVFNHLDSRIMILSDRTKECVSLYNMIYSRLNEERGFFYIDEDDSNSKKTSEGGDEEACFDEYYKSVYLMDDTNTKVPKKVIQSYSILVTGRKRAGVGFDDPTRTMLVLCTDCKDVRQNEGRIRTSNNIVYDFVDDFKTLESHWKIRASWYERRGASIVVLSRSEPKVGASEELPIDDPKDFGTRSDVPKDSEPKRRLPKNTAIAKE